MASVPLSNGVRTNLLSLQGTADLLAVSQNRLATGKKVNGALDDPLNFFTSKGLSDRSDSVEGILNGLSNGIQTLKAADKALDAITKALNSAKGLINQVAAASASSSNRATASAATLGFGGAAVIGTTTVTGTPAAGGLAASIANGETIILTPAVGTASTVTFAGLTATSTVNDVINQINTQTNGAYNAVVANGSITITSAGTSPVTVTGTAKAALLGAPALVSTVVNSPTRAQLDSFAAQFNEQMTSIGQLAQDASFNGQNLLNALTSFRVAFNEVASGTASSSTTLSGKDVSLAALGVSVVSATAAVAADFAAQTSTIESAVKTVQSYQTEFGNKLSIIQNRESFAKGLVDVLKTGADKLVNADPNLEAANVLALQTRQQLSQQALSLSVQSDQAVLRLFQ